MLKKEYDYSGLDDSSVNQSVNPLRNPVLHGFLLNHGRKCLVDSLNAAGIHAEMPKLGKKADVKITMKDEPNGCEIGYLNSYSANDTMGVSLPKMMAEWTHDGKADKKHSMLFAIDSREGMIYGIRLEKMREVDPLMELIRMQETDIDRRRELGDVNGKSNWDYFLNRPKLRREGKVGATTAGSTNGVDYTISTIDGERFKFRADLIVEIPHGVLATYRDELYKSGLSIC